MKKIEKTNTGWRVSHFDPPLELSAKRFPTENAVRLWLDSTEGQAFAAYRVGAVALRKATNVIHRRVAFAEGMPGMPADPIAPKEEESFEAVSSRIYAAINAKGWNGWENPDAPFDFGIRETYTDFVLAQDYKTQKTYKIPFTDSGETVTLGEPEEYEVTYQPAEGGETPPPETAPAPEPAPEAAPAAMSMTRTRIKCQGAVLSVRKDDKGRSIYKMRLCKSGFTDDPIIEGRPRRYVTELCLSDAVSRGVWDSAKMYYDHPDPETGERLSRKAVGGVLPGSTTLGVMKDGRKEVIGECVILNTVEGRDTQELLDATLDFGIPFAGTSVFSEKARLSRGEMEGFDSEIIGGLTAIDAQDVVPDPAFIDALPLGKVAASRDKSQNGDELTMTEREELDKLRKEAKDQSSKLATLQREKDVKAELAAGGLDQETNDIMEPILMSVENPQTRKSMIALQRRNMLSHGKRSNTGGGPQDGGSGTDDDADEPNLTPEAKAALERNAKIAGIKPEFLKLAREKRRQRAGQTVGADD